MSRFFLLVRLASPAALVLHGCAHVAPYEREHLAARTMDVSDAERYESSFNAHVHDSREGATGGSMSTGGGCGCN